MKFFLIYSLLLFTPYLHANIKVACAANLTSCMIELIKDFSSRHKNIKLDMVSASSGKLTSQIIKGAPYNIFFSANMRYPQKLYKLGLSTSKEKPYARGQLLLFSSSAKDMRDIPKTLANINSKITIALPNPDLAPYGRAAVEFINKYSLYDNKNIKFITAENLTQSMQFAMSASDYGFVGMSAISSKSMQDYNKEGVFWYKCPLDSYKSINQGMVILKNMEDAKSSQMFVDYIFSKRGRTIFKKFGYLSPPSYSGQSSPSIKPSKKSLDLIPFLISIKLALLTCFITFLIALPLSYILAFTNCPFKHFIETFVNLPIVLPPTVLGFYILLTLSPHSLLGNFLLNTFGVKFVFNFPALIIAASIYSFPFMLQPIKDGFMELPKSIVEASYTLGKSKFETLIKIILPNIKPSLLTAILLTFAHTIGAFGVLLMVGGNIPSETKVASIALYEKVEQLDFASAHIYSIIMLSISFTSIFLVNIINGSIRKKRLN